MFCARCGSAVQARDTTCPRCNLDLRLPGAIRMTDPSLERSLHGGADGVRPVKDESSHFDADATVEMDRRAINRPAAARGNSDTSAQPGSRSPRRDTSQFDDAARTDTAQGDDKTRPTSGDSAGQAGSDDRSRPASSASRNDVDPAPDLSETTSRVLREPVSPGDETRVLTPTTPPASAPNVPTQRIPDLPNDWFRDPEAEHSAVFATQKSDPVRFTPPADESTTQDQVDDVEEQHRLSAPAIAAIVLASAVLLLIVVVWALLRSGPDIGTPTSNAPAAASSPAPTSSPSATASASSAASASPSAEESSAEESSSSPSPTPTQESSTPTTSATPSPTPSGSSVPETARQCDDSVWGDGSASCQLARAAASQLPPHSHGTVHMTVFSPASNRSYDLTCTGDELVTCTGGRTIAVYVQR